MEKLYEVRDICFEELEMLNIPYSKNFKLIINPRLKSTWGLCKKKEDSFIIEISGCVIEPNVPLKTIKSVLIHEILHTCENCMNHGNLWKKYANMVNTTYGYNIKRTNSPEEYKCGMKDHKHMVECTKCGCKYFREHESALVKYPKHYACGSCGGELVRRY